MLVDAFTRDDVHIRPPSEYPALRWETYPLFLGNAGYLYLVSTAVLPLEQAMHQKSRRHFGRALTGAQV